MPRVCPVWPALTSLAFTEALEREILRASDTSIKALRTQAESPIVTHVAIVASTFLDAQRIDVAPSGFGIKRSTDGIIGSRIVRDTTASPLSMLHYELEYPRIASTQCLLY